MSLQQKGVIVKILPTEKVSDKFQKRSIWLRTEDQYPQTIDFQMTQARCDLADAYTEGEQVVIHFDLQGRVWESPQKGTVVFNTLNCWKIERVGTAPAQPTQPVQQPRPQSVSTVLDQFPEPPKVLDDAGGNNLPF